MSKASTARKLVPFDAVRYLSDDDAITEDMSAVLEMGQPDLLPMALSDVARAHAMALAAKDADLRRENL
jgi:probable addiction module antidote protein